MKLHQLFENSSDQYTNCLFVSGDHAVTFDAIITDLPSTLTAEQFGQVIQKTWNLRCDDVNEFEVGSGDSKIIALPPPGTISNKRKWPHKYVFDNFPGEKFIGTWLQFIEWYSGFCSTDDFEDL